MKIIRIMLILTAIIFIIFLLFNIYIIQQDYNMSLFFIDYTNEQTIKENKRRYPTHITIYENTHEKPSIVIKDGKTIYDVIDYLENIPLQYIGESYSEEKISGPFWRIPWLYDNYSPRNRKEYISLYFYDYNQGGDGVGLLRIVNIYDNKYIYDGNCVVFKMKGKENIAEKIRSLSKS